MNTKNSINRKEIRALKIKALTIRMSIYNKQK